MMFIDYAPIEDCPNIEVIMTCLQCNQCGRFEVVKEAEREALKED